MEIETIYGQVVGKSNNYLTVPDKDGGKRIIKNHAIRDYERNFMEQCKVYKNKLIDGIFALKVEIYYNTKGSDLDNSLKTILDCLQMARAITNDNLCYKIEAEKKIDKRNPRIIFGIQEYNPRIFY